MPNVIEVNGKLYIEQGDNLVPYNAPVDPEMIEVNGRMYIEDGSGNLIPATRENIGAATTGALEFKPGETVPDKRKRPAKAPTGPKATTARGKRVKVDTWSVKESWKGQEPSPRLVAACLHAGMTPAAVNKVRADKFATSQALGQHRVSKGEYTKVVIEA